MKKENKPVPIPQVQQHSQQPNNKGSGVLMHQELFVGPLPHPSTLQGYEQACKGAANRIIKMAESQSQHRQDIENKVISSNIKNERTAMWLAFWITCGFAIIGAVLLFFDKQVAGYISLFGPSFFHAGNYVYRKYIGRAEPKKKEEEVERAKKSKRKR